MGKTFKKYLSIVLSMLIILGTLPEQGISATYTEDNPCVISITADTTAVLVGDIITFTVSIPETDGLVSTRLDLCYNPDALQYVSSSKGGAFRSQDFDTFGVYTTIPLKSEYQNVPKTYNRFAASAVAEKPENVDFTKPFYTVTFKVLSTAGDFAPIPVLFTDDFFDSSINEIPVTYTISEITSAVHNHSLTYRSASDASCEEDGCVGCYVCTTCGRYFSDWNGNNEIDAATAAPAKLGHNWGEYSVLVEPTETATGIKRRTCSRCGKIDDVELPSTGPAVKPGMTVSITSETVSAEPGEEFTYVVTLTEVDDLCSVRLDLCYDPAKIRLVDAEAGGVFAESDYEKIADIASIPASAEYATVPVGWKRVYINAMTLESSTLDFSKNFATVTFKVLEGASGDLTPIAILPENDAFTQELVNIQVSKQLDSVAFKAHVHSMTAHQAVAATCVDAGSNAYWECTACGKLFSDQAGNTEVNESYIPVPATGIHTPGTEQLENVVAATCEADGSEDSVIYCTVCGKELSRTKVTLNMTGHAWDDGYVSKAATCAEEGVMTYTCTNDKTHTKTEPIAKSTQHTPSAEVVENLNEADCENDGSKDLVVYCSICGKELGRTTVVIDSTGHSWNEGYVSKAPTCNEAGVMTYTCKNDKTHTKTEPIAPTGEHIAGEEVVENLVPATCESEGSKDLVTYCAVCGKKLSSRKVVIDAIGHNYEGVVTTAATCDKDGVMTYTCKNDATHTYTTPIPKTNQHTPGEEVVENVIPATCEEDGSKDLVTYCTVCGKQVSRTTVKINATGHAYEGVVTTAATCGKAGVMTYTCKNNALHTYTEDIPATGNHISGTPVVENLVNATCETDGSKDLVTYCSVCHYEMLRVSTGIEKTGHDWNDGVVTTAPTCVKTGVMTYTCKNDKNHTRTETIPATGIHTPGTEVVENVVAATCTAEGSRDLVTYCSVCGLELSRTTVSIDKVAHTWGDWVIDTEPTVFEEGLKSHTCTVCGASESEVIEKLEAPDNYTLYDINNDGNVDNRDLLMLRRYLSDSVKYPMTAAQMMAADVNEDDSINNRDLILMRRRIASN